MTRDPDETRGDDTADPVDAATVASRDAVRATYDRIADHFSDTRAYPWPEVESFLADREPGTLGLDVGCGNGRHAEAMADLTRDVLAVDVSRGLLREARDRVAAAGANGVTVLQGDAATLPVRDGVVDVAVYVATLHHLPDRSLRVRSLDELARVLGPTGVGLVSAWSTVHDRFDADSGFDTTIDWTLPGGRTVPRFYHVYDPDEFRADLAESDLTVETAFVSSGNCYATVTGATPEGKHP